MDKLTGQLLGRVALRFADHADYVPSDLSAALHVKDGALILAADERASLEILRTDPKRPHTLGGHQRVDLHAALGIAPGDEIDLEGLTCDDDCGALFVIGSHSAKRKKPRGKGHAKDLARLAIVETPPARFALARMPYDTVLSAAAVASSPDIVCLPSEGPGSLLGMLEDDPHLGPFVPRLSREQGEPERFVIPGKDNGLDIEGLAWFRDRLLIGLRGPVLRGWALVLDFEVRVEDGALAIVRRGKRLYRKHALQLDGLGIRELLVDGDDILVLTGPTMTLDGAHRVFRWHGGPSEKQDTVVALEKGKLTPMFDIPFTRGYDRAEGMARCSWFDEDDALLVVYDSPGPMRRRGPSLVLADVFAR